MTSAIVVKNTIHIIGQSDICDIGNIVLNIWDRMYGWDLVEYRCVWEGLVWVDLTLSVDAGMVGKHWFAGAGNVPMESPSLRPDPSCAHMHFATIDYCNYKSEERGSNTFMVK